MKVVKEGIVELVSKLQQSVDEGGMTSEFVSSAIKDLKEFGCEYDYDTFPRLVDTEQFSDKSGETPANLAEALLWKLGKWKSYKKFAKQFADEKSTPNNDDVVFYAFVFGDN